MAKKSVTLKKSGTVSLFRVLVDGKTVSFGGSTATLSLTPGEHVLQWFVRGGQGTSYKIEITAPTEAKFSYTATLDDAQRDAGVVWFEVKP